MRLSSLASLRGFALAGAGGLIVHGVIERATQDLDYFTAPGDDRAVARLRDALERALDEPRSHTGRVLHVRREASLRQLPQPAPQTEPADDDERESEHIEHSRRVATLDEAPRTCEQPCYDEQRCDAAADPHCHHSGRSSSHPSPDGGDAAL